MKDTGRIDKLKTTAAAAGFLLLNLFLFIPFGIYSTNKSDFYIPFLDVILVLAVPAGILFIMLTITGTIINEKWHKLLSVEILLVALLTWLQSSIIAWDYGPLQGWIIDFFKNIHRGIIDGILWAGLLTAGLIYYKKLYRYVRFTSLLFIILFSAFTLFQSVQQPDIWTAKYSQFKTKPPQEIFHLSSQKNVLHIILDSFPSYTLAEIIAEDPEYYKDKLAGFTFYENTISNYPRTTISFLSYMSGELYSNQMTVRQFADTTMNSLNIIENLKNSGYTTSAVQYIEKQKRSFIDHYFSVPLPFSEKTGTLLIANGIKFINLSLFAAAPHFAKYFIHLNGDWLLNYNSEESDLLYFHFSHKKFIYQFIDNAAVTTDKPVYKYIHLYTSHAPLIVDEECRCLDKPMTNVDEAFKNLARCSLEYIIDLLDKFRALGIYKKMDIIIHSDHAIDKAPPFREKPKFDDTPLNEEKAGVFLSLMMVKRSGRDSLLNISEFPVMLSDVPAALSSLADINQSYTGTDFTDKLSDTARTRICYWYDGAPDLSDIDYFNPLYKIEVNGHVLSPGSWKFIKKITPPQKNN